MKKTVLIILLSIFVVSCGSSSPFGPDVVTDSPPTVLRLDPAQATTGASVDIFGFGFSIDVVTNIVTLGTEAAVATEYNFLTNPADGEIESITFTVPEGLAAGIYQVVVIVNGIPSNADMAFEVTGS